MSKYRMDLTLIAYKKRYIHCSIDDLYYGDHGIQFEVETETNGRVATFVPYQNIAELKVWDWNEKEWVFLEIEESE